MNTDCDGMNQYNLFEVDLKNLMSYKQTSNCSENLLSTGQAIRMRESINVSCAQDLRDAININGIASLYEPYEGEYRLIGPPTSNPPLFQPGFNYEFIECDCNCPQPAEYSENPAFSYNLNIRLSFFNPSETNYASITHPNHSAIVIQEIDKNNPTPQKCYDNNNRNNNSGKITRFNDNVFNTNVTMSPQDSIQINNPQLINNLQPGLYKIEKNYDDGSSEQTVIQKEN